MENKTEKAIGALAAASPFAGEIGRERTRDPLKAKGVKFTKNIKDFKALAQSGDAVIEGVPRKQKVTKRKILGRGIKYDDTSMSNLTKNYMAGDRWNHAETVVVNPKNKHKRMSFHGIKGQMGSHSRSFGDFADNDLVLLRPKKKMTAIRSGKMSKDVLESQSKKQWGGEMLSKKVDQFTYEIEQNKRLKFLNAKQQDRVAANISRVNHHGLVVKNIVNDWFKPKLKHTKATAKNCDAGVCSTTWSNAAAKTKFMGRGIVRGKAPNQTLPSDYLRSKDFDVVGVHRPKGSKWVDNRGIAKFRTTQTMARGAAGLALGAAAYGTAKGVRKLTDKVRGKK
jgi:hypothetical protein